jgi:hypothetical protein
MAPILRFAPGEPVLLAGEYILVGHFGEEVGADPRWYDVGQCLPFVTASSEFGPLWYIRLPDCSEAALAA